MLNLAFSFGLFSIKSYTFLVGIGCIFGLLLLVIPYRWRYTVSAGMLVDMGIVAMVAGMLFARAFYVGLHWLYFAVHMDEITQLKAGGLNWHGAVMGMLVVIVLFSRWQGMNHSFLLDHLAFALPLLAFLTWWGCDIATCSYGAEVATMADYPALFTWEGPGEFGLIAPRFATQPLGMLFSAWLFAAVVFMSHNDWLEGRRFWFVLALFSLGMFAIDGLRGDYAAAFGGLRADQWLDLVFAIIALLMFIAKAVRAQHAVSHW